MLIGFQANQDFVVVLFFIAVCPGFSVWLKEPKV